jgi:restriction endonuclease S subunit
LENLFKGSNQKQLSTKDVQNIEIPLLSSILQKKLILYCDELNNEINLSKFRINKNKKS